MSTLPAYGRLEPDLDIEWSARSLLKFGEDPLDELARTYDLIVLDHPFIGLAAVAELVSPLDTYLPSATLAEIAQGAVGPTYESYEYQGHVWALPLDAAAQVAAYRPDLLQRAEATVPRSWDDVFALANHLRARGLAVAMPMVYTDLVPTFYTIAANLGEPPFAPDAPGVLSRGHANETLDLLLRLRDACHPDSMILNPPGLLDRMGSDDVIAYCPLIFGYSNYSRSGFRPKRLRFADMPSAAAEPIGSTLGGAGIAVSARCRHPEAAARYSAWLASPATQRGAYFLAGGQPAQRATWIDKEANGATNNFFADTLATLERSFVRPRHPGYIAYQDRIGPELHAYVLGDLERNVLLDELDAAWVESLSGHLHHTEAKP